MTIQTDLLPQSCRNQRFAVTAMKCWATVWLVVALITFYICITRHHQTNRLKVVALQVASEAEPLRNLCAEEQQMRQQIKRIKQRESWLTESDSGQTLQLLGILGRAARENGGRISVESLDLVSIERPVKTNAEPRSAKQKKKQETVMENKMQLTLNGIAVDDLAVASFVAVLRDTNVFESVELQSTVSEVVNSHEARKYELLCIY